MTKDMTESKRAEQALKESEERFRSLTDATFEGICISEEGKVLETNPAFAEMFGYELSEVRGMDVLEFYAPEARELAWQLISSEHDEPYESVGLRSDDTTFDMEVRGKTARYRDHAVRVAAIRDISRRKRVEEKLKESEERHRAVVEQSIEGIYLFNPDDGRILESNEAFEELLGYTGDELLGMTIYDFIAHERQDIDRNVRRDRRERRRDKGERKYRRKDGSLVDFEASATVIPYGDEEAVCCVVHDITERKQAEETLERLNHQNELILNSAGEGIYGLDLQGKTTFVNLAAERLTGWDAEELIGWHQHDLIHHTKPDGTPYPSEECPIYAVLKDGTVRRITDEVFWRKDGTSFPVEYISTPIRERGKIVGAVVVFEDVTERKQAEERLRESEKRFRSLVRNATDLITILEEDGTISYDSPTIERLLGYHPEERVGKNAFDYLHPDDREQSKDTFAEALNNPGQVQRPVEFRLCHKDGSWRYMETTRTNLLDDPAVRGVVANSRDITERRRTEEALRESEERFRTAFEDAPIGVALVGLDGRRLRVNRALCEMLGYSEEEMIGEDYAEAIHPDDREISVERYRRVLEKGEGSYTLERRYLHSDGHEVWNLTSVSLIQDAQGDPSHLVCLHQDITERKALEEHLEHQAFHDSLTGLPNRALFLNRLEHALSQTSRESGTVAVLFVDLDDFKVVNDSLGHDAGNNVLVQVATRLEAFVRPGDTVGRIFGDEFAVLLGAPAGVEEARRVSERVQEGLDAPFDVNGQEVFVSSSIGIARGETPEDQPEEVLRQADLAMYAAKSRGKAQSEIYSPSMNTRAVERLDLERDLRRAIEREEFEAHYQPVINLRTGEISGFEALARWRHPERGLVPAEEFVVLAEETGLIRPIGQWVIEEACRQAKEWCERYPDTPPLMSVNLSASQFSRQPNLVPKTLNDTGLDPKGLQVEITERVVMDDAEFSLGKLQTLKGLGVSFAIDDYGMGYSCLYYLKRMPLDYLKIDRAFITGLGEGDQGDEAIVSGTIALAHALGLKVVAEGVETEGQLAKLKELECDLAQGYYFAKPLPDEAADRLLTDNTSW